MARPLARRFFGNASTFATTALGEVGGQGVLSVALSGTNNSTGYTNGSAATFGASNIANGQTATGTITTFSVAGALTTGSVFTTNAGTKAAANVTAVTVSQKSATGGGTGATFLVTTTGGAASYSVGTNVTIAVVSPGSGYTTSSTVTIDGASLGGVTSTNDLTFNVTSFVGTTGTISGVVVTFNGTGYTSAPTVTTTGGTIGTLTFTPTLSTTQNQAQALVVQGITSGTTNRTSGNDIIKQVSTSRYKIVTQDGTAICQLKASAPTAAGEMAIIATDSVSGTYYVTKLTARKAVITQGTGSQFATGAQVPWNTTGAVVNVSVTIASN